MIHEFASGFGIPFQMMSGKSLKVHNSNYESPLRVPPGGAPAFVPQSSACRQLCIIQLAKKKGAFSSLVHWTAPLSANQYPCNGYRFMPGRPLLAAFRWRLEP